MKILILKPSSLGDVIHALPVLRLLRRRWPEAEIYWWLATDLMPLLEGDRDLTGIIPFARHSWKNPLEWSDYLNRILEMKRHGFDLVIDLQGLARSGLFAWLAAGGLTVGLDTGREGAHTFHEISIPRPTARTHAVDWYLAVLQAVGVPTEVACEWLPPRPEVIAAVHRKWPVAGRRWLIVNPGARWMNKRWPVERFAELVRSVAAQNDGLHFAITGSRSERELGETIRLAAPDRCLNLAGETTLWEMIEWVRLGELMVTNDTGPMHVAAAMGRPTIALFGPTDPRRTGPYRQLDRVMTHRMPCAPCMKSTCHYREPLACLGGIQASQVEQNIRRLMKLPANG